MIDIAEETSEIRHPDISSGGTLLMSAFSLFHAPQHLTVLLQCMKYAPLPKYNLRHIISIFGELFSSDHFRRPSSIPKGLFR